MSSKDPTSQYYALDYKNKRCGNCAHFYECDGTNVYGYGHYQACSYGDVKNTPTTRESCPREGRQCYWVPAIKTEMDKRNKVWTEKYEKFIRTINEVNPPVRSMSDEQARALAVLQETCRVERKDGRCADDCPLREVCADGTDLSKIVRC